MYKEQRVCVC